MNALSEDLRKRVIEYVDTGHSYREAGIRFGVSDRSVCRWIRLRKETGYLKPRFVPRSPHKLKDEDLLEYVKKNPGSYLREIADHFNCGKTSVYDALKRLGITYKKTKNISRKR